MIRFYSPAPRPVDEAARQAAVDRCGLLDPGQAARLEALAGQAAALFAAPIAAVSIIDRDRQVFPARIGIAAAETPRAIAFCAHAILTPGRPLVVPDAAQDRRFAANPLVTGALGLRFYAAVPIVDHSGHALGALCVGDTRPRDAAACALERLAALAAAIAGAPAPACTAA